jgi:hypothetical protein
MSLIQDALKRKSEESEKVSASGIAGETNELPVKTPKAPQIMMLILLLAIFLAAPIGFSLYLIKPKLHTASPIVIKKASPPAILVPEPIVVPEIPVQIVQTTVVEAVVAPVVIKEEPVLVIPIQWPELKLTGIAQSGNQSLAILNGKMLASGRKIGEVTIAEVREREIIVEYRGERRVIYLGE